MVALWSRPVLVVMCFGCVIAWCGMDTGGEVMWVFWWPEDLQNFLTSHSTRDSCSLEQGWQASIGSTSEERRVVLIFVSKSKQKWWKVMGNFYVLCANVVQL